MKKLFSGSGFRSPKAKERSDSGGGSKISGFFHRSASSSSAGITQPPPPLSLSLSSSMSSPPSSPQTQPMATTTPKRSQTDTSTNTNTNRVYSSPALSYHSTQENLELSPEMVPIVTLLSAQAHRKYHSGVILLLHDLKNDGTPADRQWEEYFAVLIGTQLALWLAKDIAGIPTDKRNPASVSSFGLKEAASKPIYINFADATFRPLNNNTYNSPTVPSSTVSTEMENILVVSTTLKNRLFLQFSDADSFNEWSTAIHLSLFEFTLLQRSYTASLLSSKGKLISDIKTILENTKYRYKDWVSVRFGAGMPWRRCYIVVSPVGYASSSKKTKKRRKTNERLGLQQQQQQEQFGEIELFENETAAKKQKPMATVVKVVDAYAVYPSSPRLIDSSTIVKLDASLIFENESDEVRDSSVFIMPEKHRGVPGYDTLIRFLMPVLNAYMLYGRPKALIADRADPRSLLFGLPTLPHVHYLRVQEITDVLVKSDSNNISTNTDKPAAMWKEKEWTQKLTDLLHSKMANGYTGCHSEVKINGIGSASSLSAADLFEGTYSTTSSSFFTNPSIPSVQVSATAAATTAAATTTPRGLRDTNRIQTAATTPNPHSLRNVSMSSNLMASAGVQSMPAIKMDDIQATAQIADGVDPQVSKIGDDTLDIVNDIRGSSYHSDDDHNVTINYTPLGASPQHASANSPPILRRTLKVDDNSANKYGTPQSSPYEKYLGRESQARQFEISHIRGSSGSTSSPKSFNSQSSPLKRTYYRQQQDLNKNRYSTTDEYKDIAEKINAIELSHSSPDTTPVRNSLFNSPLENAKKFGAGELLNNIDNFPSKRSPIVRSGDNSFDSNRAEETGVFPRREGQGHDITLISNTAATLSASDSLHNPFRRPSSTTSPNSSGIFYEASSRPYSPVARPRNIHSPHSFRSDGDRAPLNTPPVQNRSTFSGQFRPGVMDNIELMPNQQ